MLLKNETSYYNEKIDYLSIKRCILTSLSVLLHTFSESLWLEFLCLNFVNHSNDNSNCLKTQYE